VVCGWFLAGFAIMSAVRPSRRDLEAVIAQLRDELRQQRREVKQLRVENEILREAAEPLIHHAPARECFAFVHARRGRFSVYRMCQVLATDSGKYCGWVRAQARRTEREFDDRELTQRIVEIHTTHPAYGAERVTREVKRQGIEVGRRRVSRLMREHGMRWRHSA
jgi:putative transposase